MPTHVHVSRLIQGLTCLREKRDWQEEHNYLSGSGCRHVTAAIH